MIFDLVQVYSYWEVRLQNEYKYITLKVRVGDRMISIAVVDDSKILCDYIKEQCLQFYKEDDKDVIIDCFLNGSLLLESKRQYDLIFLDIELGIDNGIEIARRLRKKDKQVQIVIVSGYEKYKADAYSIHCFDYLDKPLTKEKIDYILNEISEYKDIENDKDYIILKTLQGTKKIYLSSIMYCEYKERKLFIYTLSHTYDLYISLAELYNDLQDKGFALTHRAFILNLDKIKLIKNDRVILENNSEVPLSRSKKKDFLIAFENYMNRG